MMISQLAEIISSSRAISLAQSLEKQVRHEARIAPDNLHIPAATTKTAPPTHSSKAMGQ